MSLMNFLSAGEEVLSQHGPFYATNSRVIHYERDQGGEEKIRSLPYSSIETVETVSKPRYRHMALGAALAIFSAPLFYFLVISAIAILILGLGLVVYSLKEYEAYFQIHARNLTPEEFKQWRLPREGSGQLAVTIRRMIGDVLPS